MMLEEEHKNEQNSEGKATSLPSRLDTHGTRKKTRKKRDEAEDDSRELRKDYYKSPMIARALLSLFLVLVVFIFMLTFFP